MFNDYTKAYNKVISMLLEQAQKITIANGAALEVEEDNHMTYRGVTGLLEKFLGFEVPKKSTFSGQCLEKGEAIACSNIDTNPAADVARSAFTGMDINSMLLVPVFGTDGKTKAVLKLTASDGDYFNDKDAKEFEEWLSPLTKSIAAAMTGAQRFTEQEQPEADKSNEVTAMRLNEQLFKDSARFSKSVEMFNNLAHLVKEGVFITDTSGSCIYANDKCQALRDLTEQEMLGDGWKKQIQANDLKTIVSGWEEAVHLGTNYVVEFKCQTKDKMNRYLRAIAIPLKVKGEIFGFLGVMSEIAPW